MKIAANEIPLVFDMKLMRPGCVLLQAAMGGDPAAANQFISSVWLLAPTPDMKVYRVPRNLLPSIVEKVEKLARNHETQSKHS